MKKDSLDSYITGVLLCLLFCDLVLNMHGLWSYMNYVFIGCFLVRAAFKRYMRRKNDTSAKCDWRRQWGALLQEVSLLLGLVLAICDSILLNY